MSAGDGTSAADRTDGNRYRSGEVQFHVLSFEGPDEYSRAGGIATRVTGLTRALAESGFETYLWFIGDPDLPGVESQDKLHLRRWCQWISAHHRGGVYDGEEGKRNDFASSLPPHLVRTVLLPFLAATGGQVVVLAEEWQTVDAVLHLDWLLQQAGVRQQVAIFWNANNTFGFDRIDWDRLRQAAVITTVSRYMRQLMWKLHVDPLVISNGLPEEAYEAPEQAAIAEFRHRLSGRAVLAKVARWDPDKRWLLAMDTVAELKRQGRRPLLIARGGVEGHAHEVLARAAVLGLRVVERAQARPGVRGLIESLEGTDHADVLNLLSPMSGRACRVLYRAAGAVLANSGHEPFGLVGLETMAVGGVACTGGTGEDYVVPGWNGLVLQRHDPKDFIIQFARLRENPGEERRLRRRARATARWYAWREIVHRSLLPHLSGCSVQASPGSKAEKVSMGRHRHRTRPTGPVSGFSERIPFAAEPA